MKLNETLAELANNFNESTRDHIHTVVRTPNGNDYGKDLLRQHHEGHQHGGRWDHLNHR